MKEKDEVLNVIVEELSKKINKKEKLILKMIEKCEDFGYNIEEAKEIIEEYYFER